MKIDPPLSDDKKRLNKRWKSGDFNNLLELRKTLLEYGGDEVVPIKEPDIDKLLEEGDLIEPDSVILDQGIESRCHQNAARLYVYDDEVTKIGVGWALSEDGLWRQHSWAMKNNKIIETTQEREKYYGFLISGEKAKEFARHNGVLF